MSKTYKKITVLFISVIVSVVIGCGKDSSKGSVSEIYGTAAVGSPVIGTVNIKGANGKVSMSAIRADGTYTVDVSALSSPFIIFVEGKVGGESVRLYSTIDIPGRANVTPATNMVLALALGQDPETVYPPTDIKTDGKEIEDPPSQAELDIAINKVQTILENVFSVLDVPDGFDIMNGEFVADGSGFDKVLDLVKMDVDTTTTGDVVVNVTDAVSGLCLLY